MRRPWFAVFFLALLAAIAPIAPVLAQTLGTKADQYHAAGTLSPSDQVLIVRPGVPLTLAPLSSIWDGVPALSGSCDANEFETGMSGGEPLCAQPSIDGIGGVNGVSIGDPGTGTLEFKLPFAGTIGGATKSFAASDTRKFWSWSNGGVAMAGTLPAGNATAGMIVLDNTDASAAVTLAVTGGGWIGKSGTTAFALSAGNTATLTPDGSGNWLVWTDEGPLAPLGAGSGVTISGNVLNANVTSVMGRTGAVSLLSSDISLALGYVPATSLATVTINVPSQYSDLNAALTAISSSPTLSSSLVSVAVAAGNYSYSTTIGGHLPFGDRVCVAGAPTTTQAITATAAATGTKGAWSVELTVANSAVPGIAAGNLVAVENASGPTYKELHDGAWKVIAVNDSTHITVTNTSDYFVSGSGVAPPTGATGTLRIYPTQLLFNGVSGIIADRLQCLANLAIQGNETGSNTFGVWDADNTPYSQQGTINLSYLAVNGFTADNVRANYGGIIKATYINSSNAGNNGVLARDTAHISCTVCVLSGNGYLAPSGGGNGALSENGSSIYFLNTDVFGNLNDGAYARTTSEILCDTTGPCYAAVNGGNGFRAGTRGAFVQNEGGTSFGNAAAGWLADGGHILAIGGASASGNIGNSFSATLGGLVQAGGATAYNSGLNAFQADGNGSEVDATSATVSGTVGSGDVACNATNRAQILCSLAGGSAVTSTFPLALNGVVWGGPGSLRYLYTGTYVVPSTGTSATLTLTNWPLQPSSCTGAGSVAGSAVFISTDGASDSWLNQVSYYVTSGHKTQSPNPGAPTGYVLDFNDGSGDYANFRITSYNAAGLTLAVGYGGSIEGQTIVFNLSCSQ